MKTFKNYINELVDREYYVPYNFRDNFIQFLRTLKENEKENVSILYRNGNIVVSAIPRIHKRIELVCLN